MVDDVLSGTVTPAVWDIWFGDLVWALRTRLILGHGGEPARADQERGCPRLRAGRDGAFNRRSSGT
jgi:hypothetical protein